jgi:hypothetical protein
VPLQEEQALRVGLDVLANSFPSDYPSIRAVNILTPFFTFLFINKRTPSTNILY